MGARTIAIVGSDAKRPAAIDHRAASVVVLGDGDLRRQIDLATDGVGLDVVMELVGGRAFEPLLRSMAWGGRMLVVGFTSGEIPTVPVHLTMLKGASIVGVFSASAVDRDPHGFGRAVSSVFDWYTTGAIRPKTEDVPFDGTVDALRSLRDRAVAGKLVLAVRG